MKIIPYKFLLQSDGLLQIVYVWMISSYQLADAPNEKDRALKSNWYHVSILRKEFVTFFSQNSVTCNFTLFFLLGDLWKIQLWKSHQIWKYFFAESKILSLTFFYFVYVMSELSNANCYDGR